MKQDKVTFNHGKIVNVNIFYEISKNVSDYSALENCLFGAVSLTKNADINSYKYSGYGSGFDRYRGFSYPSIGLGRNLIIIFAVDMSSSVYADNNKKKKKKKKENKFWF